MRTNKRWMGALLALSIAGGVLAVPMAASASQEGRRNTALALGAAAGALLLTQRDKTPGLVVGLAAGIAATQIGHEDRWRHDRYDRDRWSYNDRYDRDRWGYDGRNSDWDHDRYENRRGYDQRDYDRDNGREYGRYSGDGRSHDAYEPSRRKSDNNHYRR